MATEDPKDKFKAVWLILFMLGLGTLLPWNFFMTATMYFNYRLTDLTPANVTIGESQNVLQAKFNNSMTLCAMIPLLIFTCLNSIVHQRIPQKIRILGSLVSILVVFCVTAILVKLSINPMPFFVITLIKIAIINGDVRAILQGSLFGMASMLPDGYTTPIMSGQGMAGTFAAFAMICALASGSDLTDCAFGFFITACVVISLAILSYIILPKLAFYRFHQEKNHNDPALREEKKLKLIKNGDSGGMSTSEEVRQNPSLLTIFKKIWVMALLVCFAFTITIGIFPAVAVDVKSTIAKGGLWEEYFIPVSGFLLFNLFDWLGRSLTAVCLWPGKDSKLLPVLLLVRVIFVPLFMLCNVQPRYTNSIPVFFSHDAWFIVFIILFAFSNGYLASLCMRFCPKLVNAHEAETAGAIMAFFMSLGLALGASFSFLFGGHLRVIRDVRSQRRA